MLAYQDMEGIRRSIDGRTMFLLGGDWLNQLTMSQLKAVREYISAREYIWDDTMIKATNRVFCYPDVSDLEDGGDYDDIYADEDED